MSNPIGKLAIYACGGTALNLVSKLDTGTNTPERGYSIPQITYVDTSRSNLSEDIPEARIELLKGVDGSGKVRRTHATELAANVKGIIQRHEPGDMNIVVFSGAGGTGATVGPLLLNELLVRNATVVCVVVGSSESKIACHNTLSTLKSLAAVSKQRTEPAVMFYIHNDQGVPRSEIDNRCRRVIAALSLLGSRQNRELDTADLANWVRYQRVTSIQPGLAVLDIYDSSESIRKVEHSAISVASLYADPDMAVIPFTPEYHCAGYPRENVADLKELHFAIEMDSVPDIVKQLESRLQDLERNTQARITHAPVVSDDEIDSDTGLVF